MRDCRRIDFESTNVLHSQTRGMMAFVWHARVNRGRRFLLGKGSAPRDEEICDLVHP